MTGGGDSCLPELANLFATCSHIHVLTDEVMMDDDRQVLAKRGSLATIRGIRTRSADGEEIEEAPCNMLLGNAILHLAKLDQSSFIVDDASVILESLTLDYRKCRVLSKKFGGRLAVKE